MVVLAQFIKKAVIPVAGLGTRFLPITKTIPKEMLPIIDRPAIQYVVEEAVQAGISEIIFVQGRGKTSIEDYFDISFELEEKLKNDGKISLIDSVSFLRNSAKFISIRQNIPRGLGHAIHCAKSIVGDEPFAVLLGDEVTYSNSRDLNPTAQLIDNFVQTSLSSVSVVEVAPIHISKYGVIGFNGLFNAKGVKVTKLVEKPSIEEAPSYFALPGRYVFTSKIFQYLEKTVPSINGEIQLTDAMIGLIQSEGLMAIQMVAQRFDIGDRLGLLKANLELAIHHKETREEIIKLLREIIKNENL